MKWSQLSSGKKFLAVLSIACASAYLVLEMLDFFNIYCIHEAVSKICLGTSFLIVGILYTKKKISILYYLIAVMWFVNGFLHFLK